MSQGALISWKEECDAIHREMDRLLTAGWLETAEERQVRKIQFMALIERRNVAAQDCLKSDSDRARFFVNQQKLSKTPEVLSNARPPREGTRGIADAIKAKAVIAQGRPVGAAIASGEAEIGVQQVAELRPVPGTEVIGEMPADLQTQIPYSAGIATKAKDAETARAPVSFLRSEAALDVLKRKGMDVP